MSLFAHMRPCSSTALLRHAVRPLSCVPPASQRLFSSLPVVRGGDSRSRPHNRSSQLPPLFSAPALLAAAQYSSSRHATSYAGLRMPATALTIQTRSFSRRSGRDPWDQLNGGSRGNWLDTVKTGALLALGAGVVFTFASAGFGVIVMGAAGYGAYTLYHKFLAPFRSKTSSSSDPFGSVQADIDRIFRKAKQPENAPRGTTTPSADKDLESLVDGLPFIVRGIAKTIFSVVGGAMKSSMARAGELRRLTNDQLQANARVVSELGHDVSISTPQSWMEYTVNGIGRVEAVFPVVNDGFAQAQVDVKASIGSNGQLQLQQLHYRNHRTGEVVDLLRDGPSSGPRKKTLVDAEYVDVDDRR